MEFEWDDAKSEANEKKHGVSFDAAKAVFADPNALVEVDPAHSKAERRFRIVGCAEDGQVLTVVFTHRADRLRMVSAQVRRKDVKLYEARRKGE